MAFRKKRGPILAEKPDILVVAKCEQPRKMDLEEWENPPNDYTWIGENPNKDLGVFTFGDYSIRKLEQYNPDYKLILPVIIQKASFELFLIGAWTKRNQTDKNRSYIAYLGHAIEEYRTFIESNQTVIIGDLNSNKIWDKKRDINHSYVVNQLLDLEIQSLYHQKFQEEQGKETRATYFHTKKLSIPHHIDYCFASQELIKSSFDFKIGELNRYYPQSDHLPLIVEFSI